MTNKQVTELPLNLRNVFGLVYLDSSVNNSAQKQILNPGDKLDANNFFNNLAGIPRPAFHQNQWGVTAGGLGAGLFQVIGLVLGRIIPTLAIGTLVGGAISLLADRWVRSLLYGVRPSDPITNMAVGALLITIALAGAAIPTFRAMRIDPASTLHQD